MPEKIIETNCCTVLLPEYPVDIFSLNFAAGCCAVYIRIKNPSTGLDALLYNNSRTDEYFTVSLNPELLKEYDTNIQVLSEPRVLSTHDLHTIYQCINHVHVVDGINYEAMVQARQTGRRLTRYDEVMLQMHERRMLLRPGHTRIQPHRLFHVLTPEEHCEIVLKRRQVLMQNAVNSDNLDLLKHAILQVVDNEPKLEPQRLLKQAADCCIQKKKLDLMFPILGLMFEALRKAGPNYEVQSQTFVRMLTYLTSDQVGFSHVKPVFGLLGQLQASISKNFTPDKFSRVCQFHIEVEVQLIHFILALLQPSESGSAMNTFASECLRSLRNLEAAVPRSNDAGLDLYHGLQSFFESLTTPRLSSFDSYSFFAEAPVDGFSAHMACEQGGAFDEHNMA